MSLRKWLPILVFIFILAFMAVTNPSLSSFKSYTEIHLLKKSFSKKDMENNLICTQTANYIIFSQYNYYIKDYGVAVEGYFIGVLGNFLQIRSTAPGE